MIFVWILLVLFYIFFFFKQKTAYEMRISDWSSDVCSSDLRQRRLGQEGELARVVHFYGLGVGRGFDKADRSFRHLAEGADHLRVSAMADEQDVPPFRHHLFGLAVNLGDKRAGGVQIFKTARRRGFRHRFRYAMRRKDEEIGRAHV